MKQLFLLLLLFLSPALAPAQDMRQDTYCNPLNIDYTYMIYNSDKDISYRSGADPAVVRFRGEYYMFVTRSNGYWHSKDLLNWDFITPKNWYPQGSNAPAAHNYKDSVLYVTGDPSGSMSILYSDDPKRGEWKATPAILHNLQDPDLFIDDDGRAYMFWGSSNVYPIRGVELDKNHRFLPKGEVKELFSLDMPRHGWERFGENHSDTVLGGYIEGPWLTKHNGRYYMQYGAPGTEFNVYADGVYVADHPMGPYTYQKHNPVSYKPGGYMNGAGHGSTVQGPGGAYWHFASMALSINVNWERRLCMFPAGFDKDGIMYVDTRFGDYPRYAPAVPGKRGRFRGWMLLSYKKKVEASSTLEGYPTENAVNEDIRTWWSAKTADKGEFMTVDLDRNSKVYAIQVNFADQDATALGKSDSIYYQYRIEESQDGITWNLLVDKSENKADAPNDYIQLDKPADTRYIRITNIYFPSGKFSISGLRVFGKVDKPVPATAQFTELTRNNDNRRTVNLSWSKVNDATGYNIRFGTQKNKLYHNYLVYEDNKVSINILNTDQTYYFAIDSFNEAGVTIGKEIKTIQ